MCYYELSRMPLKIYTRHSVFKWAVSSKIARASHVEWSVLLAPWDIEFVNIENEDERRKFAALMTVSMATTIDHNGRCGAFKSHESRIGKAYLQWITRVSSQ